MNYCKVLIALTLPASATGYFMDPYHVSSHMPSQRSSQSSIASAQFGSWPYPISAQLASYPCSLCDYNHPSTLSRYTAPLSPRGSSDADTAAYEAYATAAAVLGDASYSVTQTASTVSRSSSMPVLPGPAPVVHTTASACPGSVTMLDSITTPAYKESGSVYVIPSTPSASPRTTMSSISLAPRPVNSMSASSRAISSVSRQSSTVLPGPAPINRHARATEKHVARMEAARGTIRPAGPTRPVSLQPAASPARIVNGAHGAARSLQPAASPARVIRVVRERPVAGASAVAEARHVARMEAARGVANIVRVVRTMRRTVSGPQARSMAPQPTVR